MSCAPCPRGLTRQTRWRHSAPTISVLLVGSLAFAFLIARLVTAPLKVLSRAASAVGPDLENVALPSGGPVEVRNAATAFASMRQRIRAHVQERTRMLAAIAHDLQTPLTRMRLRVENVSDPTLRRGLFADLGAMEALVHEGLELARSADADEPFAVLNLDSLLQSLAQDATDTGQSVRFSSGCGAHVRVRPQSLKRCISNLVDNALKFAGSAEVSSSVGDQGVVVSVRDFGDGIPETNIATVMDTFVRGETSRSRKTGGVGLGLTIAQILADKNESSISLRNHPDGGLEATIAYLPTVKGGRLQPAG